MDPFIESQNFWPDFHARFITYWADCLAELLPEQYEARMDERVNLVETPLRRTLQRLQPDVAVERQPGAPAGTGTPPQGVAVLEPVTVPLEAVEEDGRETYIEILHRPDRVLVAVLELLSPSNKEEPGFGAYRSKRNGLLRHPVHLVEVDLLLRGNRLPLGEPLPEGDYFAFVARAGRRPECQVYAWGVRQPLPAIPVPLANGDPDVWVDLAAVFNTTFDRGRYARSLDYGARVPHPLSPADRDWVSLIARGN
jgi:hypothetical protein